MLKIGKQRGLILAALVALPIGAAAAAPAPGTDAVPEPGYGRPVSGQAPGAQAIAPATNQGAVTDHVIVVSIDGLRPDAIGRYELKTLSRLIREGAYDSLAQTILPSKTLPSHTSMLTGVPPAEHGITWNDDRSAEVGPVAVPTVFEVARASGFTTAAFFSKPKFHHLERPGSLDYSQAPDGGETWLSTRTVPDAISYLRAKRPNLLFVHLPEPDGAGHLLGWMSFAYKYAVRLADAGVAELIEAADETYGRGNYTLLVTADHGGHGRDHGSDDPRDTTIPWVAWGEGVSDALAAGSVRTMDTAATALWLLGVDIPAAWTGRAVEAAFSAEAQLAASAQQVPGA